MALEETGLKRVALSGGVASNKVIRTKFFELSDQMNIQVFFPTQRLCTDNGIMIAWAGIQKFISGFQASEPENIEIYPRWPLSKI